MNLKVRAYPNPFGADISLEVICEQSEQVIFRLYNPSGKVIKMSYWKLVNGMNKIILDNLDRLTVGSYVVELKDNNEGILYSTELLKE
ncbi:MAG TPA: T9SS type A sorting domain-containing protein [Chitinophagaceae bacterium]